MRYLIRFLYWLLDRLEGTKGDTPLEPHFPLPPPHCGEGIHDAPAPHWAQVIDSEDWLAELTEDLRGKK